jgi:hypothetical protein
VILLLTYCFSRIKLYIQYTDINHCKGNIAIYNKLIVIKISRGTKSKKCFEQIKELAEKPDRIDILADLDHLVKQYNFETALKNMHNY